MLVSSLVIGVLSKTTNKIPLLAAGLVSSGLFYALIGVSPNLHWITACAFFFFLSLPCVNTSLDVLVRRNVTKAMQGRVMMDSTRLRAHPNSLTRIMTTGRRARTIHCQPSQKKIAKSK